MGKGLICNMLEKALHSLHIWAVWTRAPLKPIYGRAMWKRVFGHMRLAKAQISLRIRAVWSGPLMPAAWIIGYHRIIGYYSITKTYLYNFDPLKPHFYLVKQGFTGVYIIFLSSVQNIDCGYSLEPPRRGGSNEYPQSMFWAEIWKISDFFFIWKFSFLGGEIFNIFE